MKLSDETVSILKNFSTINESIVFEAGQDAVYWYIHKLHLCRRVSRSQATRKGNTVPRCRGELRIVL